MKLYSCCICKKKKSVRSFDQDSGRGSGIASRCKPCLAKRDNGGRYEKRREYFLNYQREYKLKHPEKILARKLVKEALLSGKLKQENCQDCGSKKPRAHHPDYSKPLQVIWLCQKHHQRTHARLSTA